MRRRQALALAAISCTPLARAQTGHSGPPLRLVAPFPPGGTVDILSRALAERLGRELGQSMIVDNRGGAGGTIGADIVSKAPADGSTLLFGAVHHAIAQSVYPKLGYDIRQMAPIAIVGRVNHAVIVHNALPAKDIKELVALLKAAPDKYSYATPGAGTMQHLMTELFKGVTHTSMLHVPYRGSGPAMIDLISGNTQVMFETMPSALQHIRAGSVRAIAVTSSRRAGFLPDVATIAEGGTIDYDASSWYGLYAPAKTPAAAVERINLALNRIFTDRKFVDQWVGLGAEIGGGSAADLGKLTAAEVERWAVVAKASKISVH